MRPYHTLSSGEQAVVEAARLLAERSSRNALDTPVGLDEFTSTIDRAAASRQCQGLAMLVRKRRTAGRPLPPIIVATVHDDILQWLLPDWVFFGGTGQVMGFTGPEP